MQSTHRASSPGIVISPEITGLWSIYCLSAPLCPCTLPVGHRENTDFTEGEEHTIWIIAKGLKLRLFSRPKTTRHPRCSPHRTCYGKRGGKKGFPNAASQRSACLIPMVTWSIPSMPQVAHAAIPAGRATTRCLIPLCRMRSNTALLGGWSVLHSQCWWPRNFSPPAANCSSASPQPGKSSRWANPLT